MLMEQLYPGDEDYIAHFNAVLPAFKDPRYIRVNGEPLFMIYAPMKVPDIAHFIELWQKLAKPHGFRIHFVGHTSKQRNCLYSANGGLTPPIWYVCLMCSKRTIAS